MSARPLEPREQPELEDLRKHSFVLVADPNGAGDVVYLNPGPDLAQQLLAVPVLLREEPEPLDHDRYRDY